MADVKRVVTADVYAWMTPVKDVPGRFHHNIARRGDEIEVSEEEAERGEGLGLLEDPSRRAEADEAAEDEAAVEDDAAARDAVAVSDEERPARQASKGAWVDYAVSRGMDRDEAESMTRDQLITATG
jgi:hypothetical protein